MFTTDSLVEIRAKEPVYTLKDFLDIRLHLVDSVYGDNVAF